MPAPAAIDPALLDGIIKGAEGEDTIKILNPERFSATNSASLAFRGRAPSAAAVSISAARRPAAVGRRAKVSLVSFELGSAGICAAA